MAKKRIHRKHQRKAAGRRGQIEVHINGFLDVKTPKKAIEIERTGKSERIEKALHRLAKVEKPHKILKVPNKDLPKACRIARMKKQKVTISNLSSTKYCYPRSR
jgi:hypothetical protein